MPTSYVKIEKVNERPFRLVPAKKGKHKFGGSCAFKGLKPKGCKVPIQQLLLLDLRDVDIPFKATPKISFLPLLYPFKYGFGGPEVQYSLVDKETVKILHISPNKPDEPDFQYLQVPELPPLALELTPLTYEEARCLTFMREDGFFRSNEADKEILNRLDCNHLISLGGRRNYIPGMPDVHCRNPKCERYEKRTSFKLIASIPPIPVNGEDDFWYEFRGAYMSFHFGLCYSCHTIISFNTAS